MAYHHNQNLYHPSSSSFAASVPAHPNSLEMTLMSFGMIKTILTSSLIASVIAVLIPSQTLAQDSSRFDDFEIRVIRPKYFTKRSKFELGLQLGAIVNDPFLYTFQAHGNLTYHFNEGLGLELSGSYGITTDRSEKRVLTDNFNIRPSLYRPQHFGGAALIWTPLYGKFQVLNTRLVYFEFFGLGGLGATGIFFNWSDCPESDRKAWAKKPENNKQPSPTSSSSNFVSFHAGGGQKIFLNKKISLRWDVLYMGYRTTNTFCKTGKNSPNIINIPAFDRSESHKGNVVMKLGLSRFF